MRRVNDREITVETRADGGRMITGYAAVFYRADDPGTEFELMPGFVERISPTFFDNVFAKGLDTRGMYNHRQLLARFPRTMRLSTDEIGLRYEIDVPDTNVGRDLIVHLERDDIRGSSFAFDVAEGGQSLTRDGNRQVRMLTEASELADVGPVDFPAYEATTAEVRSSAAKEIEKLRTQHEYRMRVEKRLATLTE